MLQGIVWSEVLAVFLIVCIAALCVRNAKQSSKLQEELRSVREQRDVNKTNLDVVESKNELLQRQVADLQQQMDEMQGASTVFARNFDGPVRVEAGYEAISDNAFIRGDGENRYLYTLDTISETGNQTVVLCKKNENGKVNFKFYQYVGTFNGVPLVHITPAGKQV